MRLTIRATLALLMLIAATGLTGAEEEAKKSPAELFQARVAKLPAPAATGAFKVEGRVFVNGQDMGSIVMSAEVAEWKGKPVWKVRDLVSLAFGPNTMKIDSMAHLSSRLATLGGTEIKVENEVKSVATYEKTATGYSITTKAGEETKTKAVEHKGDASDQMAGLILFCRQVVPEKATFACYVIDTTPEEGDENLELVKLVFRGNGKWNGMPAFLVDGMKGEDKVSLAFDAKTRAFLGLKVASPNGMTMEVKPKDAVTPEKKGKLAPPAKTAEDAALLAALAFGTGDTKLLSAVADWPSLHKDFKSKNPMEEMTQAELKEKLLGNLEGYKGKQPRSVVEPVLVMIRPQLKVKKTSETLAVVTFPEVFQSLVLTVGKVGDHWFLVKLPGT